MRSNFFRWAVTAFATVALVAAVSCNKPDEGEPAEAPTVALTLGTVDSTSFEVNVIPANADRVAYVLVNSGEEVPAADAILAEGTAVDIADTVTVTISDLTPETKYTVAAAAANGETLSAVATVEATTLKADGTEPDPGTDPDPDVPEGETPAVTIGDVTPAINTVTFTYTAENASEIAYVIEESPGTNPGAEAIFSKGTVVKVSDAAITVENLEAEGTYVLHLAARNGDVYSEPNRKNFRTLSSGATTDAQEFTFTEIKSQKMNSNGEVKDLTIAFGDEEGNELKVTFKCNLDANSNVAAGTYSVSKTYLDAGDIRPGEQYAPSSAGFAYLTTAEGVVTAITGGSMIVSEGEIAFNFTTNVNSISATYKGSISVAAVTSIGSTMTEDMTITFADNAVCKSMGDWSDEIRLSITDANTEMNITLMRSGSGIPIGTFGPTTYEDKNNDSFVMGQALSKKYVNGQYIPTISCYYSPSKPNNSSVNSLGTGLIYTTDAGEVIACPAYDGEITITETEGVYTINFTLKDDIGHTFSGSVDVEEAE
ncbi:MAG TPA: hypothetical protein IAC04_04670 [Candidatus Coprenecus stercoravium]|uniref:Fibronectin type-III domain-containing protein n=1 Tax=Candidatus Coprenecus stercoravium TaxID=2840735 RepID=A0A9D2GRR2_9BACT|nr:hypothetical protein [Candidatus Coprenecus stercoravium]